MKRYASLVFVVSLSVAVAQSTYQSPQFFLKTLSGDLLRVSDGKSALIDKVYLQPIASGDQDVERPAMVELRFKVLGHDEVSITPAALFGKYDRFDPSMSNMRHQLLSTQSVKLHESVSFPELERLGVRLNYTLVSAQPDRPYRPRLVSRAHSLTFEFVQIDRIMGRITVHNHSNKAVIAFQMSKGTGPLSRSGRVLIAPREKLEFDSDAPNYGWCIEKVCGPEPLPLILQDAVFEDGSYEGDEIRATEQAADWFGRSTERERILRIAVSIMSNLSFDELARINELASALHQVSIEPDGRTVGLFQVHFSDLPSSELHRGESLLTMNMRGERDDLEFRLQIEKEAIHRKTHYFGPLAVWWANYAGY